MFKELITLNYSTNSQLADPFTELSQIMPNLCLSPTAVSELLSSSLQWEHCLLQTSVNTSSYFKYSSSPGARLSTAQILSNSLTRA